MWDWIFTGVLLCSLACGQGSKAETFTFDKDEPGKPPAGWIADWTGTKKGAAPRWEVKKEDGGNVLAVESGGAGGDFPVCIRKETSFKDGTVGVRLKPISGSKDQAGGVVFRAKDPNRETESYASMTESGLSDLCLYARLLGTPAVDAKVLERARKWVAENFSVAENRKCAYQEGRLIYHLWALDRAGALRGTSDFGGHDWWKEGAGILLGNQKENGSWDDGADTAVPNTALALLFLTRSSEFLK